jgi:trigger factor
MTDLQVSVEAQQSLERRIRVQVPADRVDQEVDSRLLAVGKTAKLKGFRPGKIPAKVLRQHYGVQVRQEVIQEVVQSSYSEAIDREKLRPASGPAIEPESIEEGEDLVFTAVVEIYPDISLIGLDSLEVDEPETEIADADIDQIIANLREQHASFSPVDRKAADGDQLTVDFQGTLGGEPFDGGQGEDVQFVLGAGQMLADFEKNVHGLKTGAEKTFKLKFPKDYHQESLAGQKVEFSVTVKAVAEKSLPEINPEFVRGFGVESGELEEFRADVRGNMERELASKIKASVKRQLMDQLLDGNPTEVPAVLADQESASLRSEAMRNMGISDPDQAPALDSFREAGERRVRLGLLVGAVISENDIELDRDRLKDKVDEMTASYDQPEELRKMYFQNPQLLSSVENIVLEEQVIEWLLARASVRKKTMNFQDLMSA